MSNDVHLVHPPAPSLPGLPPRDAPSPPWDLVCLHAYLASRSSARVTVTDFRLPSAPEPPRWAARLSRTAVVLLRVQSHNLPEAASLLRTLPRYAPHATIVLWGPLASSEPARCAALPGIHAVLAGDPEPLARAFLATRDIAARLRNVPGILPAGGHGEPAWLPSLESLTLPTWDDPLWRMYVPRDGGSWRPLMRLTRGDTGRAADMASSGGNEPLRTWPLTQMALAIGRTSHLGGTDAILTDPPGIWTPDRVEAWCRALIEIRNSHPWSFRTLPRAFSEVESRLLAEAGCRSVEILFPSTEPARLTEYDIPAERREWVRALDSLRRPGRRIHIRVWLGGPRPPRREASRASRLVARLGFPPADFRPHPFSFHAPLTARYATDGAPSIDTWFAQAAAPDEPGARLIDAWGGAAGLADAVTTCAEARRQIDGSFRLRIRRTIHDWRKRGIIDRLEDAAVRQFRRGPAIDR